MRNRWQLYRENFIFPILGSNKIKRCDKLFLLMRLSWQSIASVLPLTGESVFFLPLVENSYTRMTSLGLDFLLQNSVNSIFTGYLNFMCSDMNICNMQNENLDVQCHQNRTLWFYLVKVLYLTQYPVYSIGLWFYLLAVITNQVVLQQNSLGTPGKLAHTKLFHVSLAGSAWYWHCIFPVHKTYSHWWISFLFLIYITIFSILISLNLSVDQSTSPIAMCTSPYEIFWLLNDSNDGLFFQSSSSLSRPLALDIWYFFLPELSKTTPVNMTGG